MLGGVPGRYVEESHPMSVNGRPAIPALPARRGAYRARRDWLLTRLATCITVLAAAVAVLIVAAAAVTFTIT